MVRFQLVPCERGTTEQQWRMLHTLNDTGDVKPSQLTDARLILSPSLTRMLAAMEQSGMIMYTKSSVDQRCQVISLTPRSHQFLAGVEPQVDAEYVRTEAQLGRARFDTLYVAIDGSIQIMEVHTPMGRFIGDE